MEIPCASCNGNVEFNLRIFYECDIAKDILRLVNTWCDTFMPSHPMSIGEIDLALGNLVDFWGSCFVFHSGGKESV